MIAPTTSSSNADYTGDPFMADRQAGCVPLTVVAAKKPGHWIVRAMGPFYRCEDLLTKVRAVVGVMDPEVEWSSHVYEGYPGYLVYGGWSTGVPAGSPDDGPWPKMECPRGVWRWDCRGGDTYGPAVAVG